MPKRSLEEIHGRYVDNRTDTTRKGYSEKKTVSGGSNLSFAGFLGPLSPIAYGIDELDRRTNMTRQDSPIYHPGLITGEAPSFGLGKVVKTKGMIRSMKDAVKASGKSYSPALRGNNKTYNYNAITANDVFNESKVVSGAGVYAKPKPKFTPKTKGNSEWWTDLDEGNSFIKANKLTPFKASNGKDYVKLPDGSIKSVEGIGKRIRAKDEDFINYLRGL